MNTDCPHADNIASALTGELNDADQLALQRHLHDCPGCRETLESHRQIIEALRALPRAELSRDLTPLIIDRVRANKGISRSVSRKLRLVAAIATIALFAGVAWKASHRSTPAEPRHELAARTVDANVSKERAQMRSKARAALVAQTAETRTSISRALDFFCASQEADGSWSAERWGGCARFGPALTGLSLIVLLENESTSEHEAAAHRAIAWLKRQQRPDGTFSSIQGGSFTQGICTLALLHSYQKYPDGELSQALGPALRVVLANQHEDGGWGSYQAEGSNPSITLWNRDVVALASKLGWSETRESHARALKWLGRNRTSVANAPEVHPGTVIDFHRAYFSANRLCHRNTAPAQERLAALRQALISCQSTEGEMIGTWAPGDQWSRAGGRIYATALATLSLR